MVQRMDSLAGGKAKLTSALQDTDRQSHLTGEGLTKYTDVSYTMHWQMKRETRLHPSRGTDALKVIVDLDT